MSVLTYPLTNDEEVFKLCTKQCGIITATEDHQYFALGCIFCPEKFLYFDTFIGHLQTVHAPQAKPGDFLTDMFGGGGGAYEGMVANEHSSANVSASEEEDLTDADPALLEPQMVMIKEEPVEIQSNDEDAFITGLPQHNVNDITGLYQQMEVKNEPVADLDLDMNEQGYDVNGAYNHYEDYAGDTTAGDDDDDANYQDDEDDEDADDSNYDDLVEESLLGISDFKMHQKGVGGEKYLCSQDNSTQLTMHIKDRKMIQFLIDSYRRNPFLWDHHHPQFRDRIKRQQFLDWFIYEFKRRFNISLAKDAVTRKWDNLRTVYKRECNRMTQEKTNVSTLWYFKELHFLNRLYGGNQEMSEAVVKETVYRRRYSALWNDVSTNQLLSMVRQHPCFYDKYNIDYRSKERRGEALQIMAAELQNMIDVSTIQISKRISQLRFDYSKQKQERLLCEQNNRVFVPNYTYYNQMHFMDADISPFKCEFCPALLQTYRELEVHELTHQPNNGCVCAICHMTFLDNEQLNRHKQIHLNQQRETKYHCDLCTASFREKDNYEEHMRRHNDELLLPGLASATVTQPTEPSTASSHSLDTSVTSVSSSTDKPFVCDICGKGFASHSYLNAHRAQHSSERAFRCDYQQCGRAFTARQGLLEHMRLHYSDEEYNCEICGKTFKSIKNLQNHKQIHDAIKRYVCKICGSAFAQAAGLYLHKRRHNRPNSRIQHNF